MIDDAVGVASPARSVASVASTMSEVGHVGCGSEVLVYPSRVRIGIIRIIDVQRVRVPASLSLKSKPDLELYAMDLLKKLRVRDKKIDGTHMHAQRHLSVT